MLIGRLRKKILTTESTEPTEKGIHHTEQCYSLGAWAKCGEAVSVCSVSSVVKKMYKVERRERSQNSDGVRLLGNE